MQLRSAALAQDRLLAPSLTRSGGRKSVGRADPTPPAGADVPRGWRYSAQRSTPENDAFLPSTTRAAQKTGTRWSPPQCLSTPAPHLGHAMASTACTSRASFANRSAPTLLITRPRGTRSGASHRGRASVGSVAMPTRVARPAVAGRGRVGCCTAASGLLLGRRPVRRTGCTLPPLCSSLVSLHGRSVPGDGPRGGSSPTMRLSARPCLAIV